MRIGMSKPCFKLLLKGKYEENTENILGKSAKGGCTLTLLQQCLYYNNVVVIVSVISNLYFRC